MLESPEPRTRCHDSGRLQPAALPAHPRPWLSAALGDPSPAPPAAGPVAQPPTKLFRPGLEIPGSGLPSPVPFHLEPLPALGASGPPPHGPPSLSGLFGEGLSTLRGAPEGRQRRARLLSRLHLDIISTRSCPQDDHAGRSCAQDDAAGPGAELPAQRVPAGR